MMWTLQVSIATLCLFAGFVFALECPNTQYPYTCTTCLGINDTESDFNVALDDCRSSGGDLLPVEDGAQFSALKWYLSGLGDDRKLWIGYKFNGTGVLVDTKGDVAPDVVLSNDNYVGGDVTGDENVCIGIQMEKFFTAPCSDSLAFVCSYIYQVPKATGQAGGQMYVSELTLLALEVQFDGLGIIGVEWRHNGMELGQGIETTVNSGFTEARLTVDEFHLNTDSGRYEILAKSPVGRAVLTTWEVKQAVLGNLTVTPQDLVVPPGEIAAFECEASEARPKAQITWYKDSITLNANGGRFYVSDVSGTLFIREVEVSDGGMYHCEASNGAGKIASATAQLSVIENEPMSNYILHPRNTAVLTGNPYSVECVGVQSVTPTSKHLIYKSKNLEQIGTFTYPNDTGFPIHRIDSVTMEDGDDYLCQFGPIPFNLDHQPSFSRSGLLIVHSKPRVDSITVNGAESGLHSIPHGTRIALHCMVSGIPIPDVVVWTVDGRTINETSVDQDGIAVLEIDDFSETGIYQCHGSNSYGNDVNGIVLCMPDGVPGVVPFHVVSDSNSSLYVTWSEPNHTDIHPLLLRYEVVYTNLELGVEGSSGLLPSNSTKFIITGLNSSTEYTVYVVAYSIAGVGEQAVATTVSTFSNAPDDPIPVSNIILQRSADDMVLHVGWPSSPLPANLIRYEIEYRDMSTKTTNNVTAEGEVNFTTIEGLNRARNYEVRIRILVQIQRDPVLFDHTPWSQWQGVAPSPTPQPPTVDPAPVGTEEDGDQNDLLLVIVIGPIVVVTIVGVVVAMVIVAGCWWYKHKPEGSYRPRDEEKKLSGRRIPMGDQIFSLPIGNQVMDRPLNHSPLATLDDSHSASSKDYLVSPTTPGPDA